MSPSSFRPKLRRSFFIFFASFAFVFVVLGPKAPPTRTDVGTKTANKSRRKSLSYETLQRCLDEYTSNGSWNGTTWRVKTDYPTTCRFQSWDDDDDKLAAAFRLVKRIGFMGDSTTRADLKAWEEHYQCNETNLDEAQVFQRRNEEGDYICQPWEQSINLTKCGYPPIIDVADCPSGGAAFRYFYKIYPWTPLDQWYLSQQQHLFRDIDVLVISLGRWFVYYQSTEPLSVTNQMETFLVELRKVYSGIILYHSEYTEHLVRTVDKSPAQCTPHAICGDCGGEDKWECAQTETAERPQRDVEMRSVMERHQILYLDRWNTSKSLPLEYYQDWYCNQETFNQWFCSHHLGFVALQHMRLIAIAIKNLFTSLLVENGFVE